MLANLLKLFFDSSSVVLHWRQPCLQELQLELFFAVTLFRDSTLFRVRDPRRSKKKRLLPKDMMPSSSHHEDEALENTTHTLAFITQLSQECMLMPWMATLTLVVKGTRRVKLADAEGDLLRKEGRCLKYRRHWQESTRSTLLRQKIARERNTPERELVLPVNYPGHSLTL